MKKCSKCLCFKNPDCFNKNNNKADGLQNICRECSNKRSTEHYKNNKQDYIENRDSRRQLLKQFVFDFLKEHPCVDCGEKDPIVLEFDHLKDKLFTICEMAHSVRSFSSLKEEVSKCEVRCSNCHKRKTAIQFNWYKNIIK